MPACRSRMRCAFAEPVPKRARAPRTTLSAEEKEEKARQKVQRAAKKTKVTEWDASLKPWVESHPPLQYRVGTLGMFKSDAKSAYKLTESDMLSLPHESIPNSWKTYYALDEIVALAQRKLAAGAAKDDLDPHAVSRLNLRVLKKTSDGGGRRKKSNWSEDERGRLQALIDMSKATKKSTTVPP